MRLHIVHETAYRFTKDIFLEPHYLRLKPRTTQYNKLESFDLVVDPKPAGLSQQRDEEGNLVYFCWFEGLTGSLTIRTESIVVAEPFNPFGFILHPASVSRIPFQYDETQRKLLGMDLEPVTLSKPLVDFGATIAKEAGYDTVTFLSHLTRRIHESFEIVYREEGDPHTPDEAFAKKVGSCRDLTWMQINVMRAMGLAARFVSGYYYFPMEDPGYELHAWLEVFLPGAGWVGFDPSHGIIAGNTHIPIVSGAHYEHTMPVTGTFRGEAEAELKTKVAIKEKL